MSPLRSSLRGPAVFLALLPCLLASSAPTADPGQEPKQGELTPAAARKQIDAMYRAWGRARVELDKEAMDSILAPEFYVLLDGRKITREKFLHDVSQPRSRARLTRFDAKTLTVQKNEKGWTVVITEKLELEIPGPDETKLEVCSLWITRDGCRKEGDRWLVTFSEAIGWENWKPGTKPPIKGW